MVQWHRPDAEHVAIIFQHPFPAKGGSALVWKTRGLDNDESTAAGLPFPIDAGSVLGLARGSQFYRGSVPEDNGYAEFYSTLELAPPREAIVLPLYVSDRLIGIRPRRNSWLRTVQ